ncbi:MAG: hypothetical protein U1F43_16265 [Myxococcota bacterium]
MRRNVVIPAVVFALVVGVVVAVVALTTPVRRFPVGGLALGGDAALLFTRYNDYGDSRFFAELVGVDGDARWSDDTTPVRGAEALGFTGAVQAGDSLVMLGVDKAGVEWLGALAAADGQPRWWIALPGLAGREAGGRIGPMLSSDGARVFVVHETKTHFGADGGPTSDRLDVRALADGSALWSLGEAELGAGRLDVRRVGGHLLVASAGGREVRDVDPATGKTLATLPFGNILCSGADGFAAVAEDRLTWVPLAPGAAPVPLDLRDPGLSWSNTCGFRGDDLVVNLERPTGWSVVRVVRATGRVQFDLPLGTGVLGTEPVMTGAQLPRFVPFAYCGSDGPVPWCELAIADVDLGRVSERHHVIRSGELVPIMTGERAWVWADFFATLVAVDPASGKLGAATRFAGIIGHDLRADDIAADRLWLLGMDHEHPGDLPFAVVDLKSGAVVRTNGPVEASDATATVPELMAGRP